MNAHMIKNREYTDTHEYYTQQVNNELIVFAEKYYQEKLSTTKIKEICSLSLEDKLWLLTQYKEETSAVVGIPDLNDLY